MKDYEKAIQAFDTAYTLDNSCYDAIYNKGQLFIEIKEYPKAISYLLEYNKMAPDDIEGIFDIAYCYYKMAELENSKEWLNKVLKINSNHKDANNLQQIISRIENKRRTINNGVF